MPKYDLFVIAFKDGAPMITTIGYHEKYAIRKYDENQPGAYRRALKQGQVKMCSCRIEIGLNITEARAQTLPTDPNDARE